MTHAELAAALRVLQEVERCMNEIRAHVHLPLCELCDQAQIPVVAKKAYYADGLLLHAAEALRDLRRELQFLPILEEQKPGEEHA